MDVFVECLVEKKPDGKEIALKICLITAAAALSVIIVFLALLMAYLPLVTIVAGVVWLASYIIRGINVEYEYILTNKDLDIDKITGKRKRKRLVTLNLLSAEGFSRYGDNFHENFGYDYGGKTDVTVFAHDCTFKDLWCLIVRHPTHGKVLLLFSPSGDFITSVNNALPPKVRNQW
ncbi:MAG: hypothetical protein LBI36_05440 [Oscillospiraceae bacterium]|nr:hypothetical protein [Oscillospiraceae bacterium]